MLYDLITGPLAEENSLIAYQIALDVSANENHGFVD